MTEIFCQLDHTSMFKTLFRARLYAALLFCGMNLSGCGTVAYYSQSIGGHLSIWWEAKPIAKVLSEDTVDEKTARTLAKAVEIRRFASDILLLPNNQSYLSYANIGRPYAVWNVFAAPEFSVSPKLWCYFFVGCVGYRGYYSEEDANDHAAALEQKRYDVSVSGVSAYSTLGWFDDPLLNTMIDWSDRAVASLMFHELAHQVLYVDGDADFNEAFASAVEQLGTVIWLEKTHPDDVEDYLRLIEQQQQFRQLLLDTRRELNSVYSNANLSDEDKRRQKKFVIENLRQRYHREKLQWYKPNNYDAWFNRPINNARLTATMTYLERIPAFFSLFKDSNHDWSDFYARVKILGDIEKSEREKSIQDLLVRKETLRDVFY